ncbi:uncharacterized protein LOC131605087 [Vicia villosa]|uniref:uncharacterized protein LOC131605087 n=1 Tax=Vicia villosa TaxID=3911 RepID=UPI00273C5BCC|nr:uncharacterized protein LOC131605087 [Vicia villosa]
MARPIEAVKDINDSKDLWKVAVRCKHMWTVTSASNKVHLELILVDSNLDMIQAIIPPHLVSKYQAEIVVGGSYVMQNFKVSTNDFSFKATTHAFKLVFCGSTFVKKSELSNIPLNYVKVLDLASIVDGKFQSNLLVDVVGGVTEIIQTQVNVDDIKSKVVFIITDVSKSLVQCTLWGQLAIQFNDYYKTLNDKGNVVVLIENARIKGATGGYPLNVSNAWTGTKLTINDVSFPEISKLKESLKEILPKLSSSSLQVETTQNSQYSDFDKFIWKADILSLAEINTLQHEATCVTVAKLEKFEVGQAGWYYDGCGECTKSVSLKDGKLKCYANHITYKPVPRFKLEVMGTDGKFKARFVFWDVDCVKLIGKSASQIKTELIEAGEDNPFEFPIQLDAMLTKKLAIRAVFQPKFNRLSVIGFKDDDETRKKIRDSFKCEEVCFICILF